MSLDAVEPEVTDSEGSTLEEVASEESAASEDEAQAASEEPESNEEEATEEESTQGRGSKLQKLIDSKGGDEDKLADSWYEMMNSSSRLAKELKELKELVTTKFAEPEAKESEIPLDDNQDYKGLKDEITALEQEKGFNEQRRANILQEYSSLQRGLAKLEGQLAKADDLERPVLLQEQYQKEHRIEVLKQSWDSTYREDRVIERERKGLERQLRQVEAELKSSRVKQQQQWQEDLEAQRSFREDFDNSVYSVLNSARISDEDKQELYDVVRLQTAEYIRKNGALTDVEKFVNQLAGRHLSRLVKTDFQQLSKAKTAISKPAVKASAPKQIARPSSKPKGQLSYDEARSLIDRWADG